MDEVPVMSYLLDNGNGRFQYTIIEICQGMFSCTVDGEEVYYPILASGKVSVELMEVAEKGMTIDVVGFFKQFCWENGNLERHMLHYLLVTEIYYDGKDMSKMISDKNCDVGQLIEEKKLVPINSVQYERLIKKLIC